MRRPVRPAEAPAKGEASKAAAKRKASPESRRAPAIDANAPDDPFYIIPRDITSDVLTIAPDNPIWTEGVTPLIRDVVYADLKGGGFVRLQPPPGTRSEILADVRKLFGAENKLQVQPARRAMVLPSAVHKEPTPDPSSREIVLKLVEQATTNNRTALLARVETTLAVVGL